MPSLVENLAAAQAIHSVGLNTSTRTRTMTTPDTSSRARRNYLATLGLFVLGLTLVAGLLAHITDADSSMTRVTAHRKYVVAMRPLAEAAAVDDLRAWEIRLTSPGGRPVAKAQIDIDTPEPQRGQHFAMLPRVTEELGGGRYLLEGTKPDADGLLRIRLSIRADAGSEGDADHVTFEHAVATRRVQGKLDVTGQPPTRS
jgi:hypothetical protein